MLLIVYCEETLTIIIEPKQVPEKILDGNSLKTTEPTLDSAEITTIESTQVNENTVEVTE